MNPLAVGKIASGIMSGLDGLFTSDEERAKGELLVLKELNQPHILQAMTNIEEAKHPSIFVAGARPALLWICASGLAWSFVLRPFAEFGIGVYLMTHPDVGPLDIPTLDSAELMTLVLALLGLGGMRSVDKKNGVARN